MGSQNVMYEDNSYYSIRLRDAFAGGSITRLHIIANILQSTKKILKIPQ
jgi:hypothetical protein